MADLGWHLQLWIDARDLPELLPPLAHLHVQVVVDHMGRMEHHHGTSHPGFQALLRGVGEGRLWSKLSGTWALHLQTMQKPGRSTTPLLPPIRRTWSGVQIGLTRARRGPCRTQLVY